MLGLVDANNFYVSCERVFDRRLVGKPVAVLSNNDGCCVAMSPEFKALGIKRGTPHFQLREREQRDGLIFRSSNYELYGDMSRRIVSILRDEALEVEQYSIDEAFIVPPRFAVPGADFSADSLFAYGRRLRAKILRWTGIPCGIGFAPTKTLAKIANHTAKKTAEGVLVMPEDPTPMLAALPVEEVWGVGRRLPVKLQLHGIVTALQLRDAPVETLRRIGGVTLARTAMELSGRSAVEERDYDADPDSVSCSRSFGEPVTDADALGESIAFFIAQAAVKLRKHRMFATGCNLYVQRGDLSFDGRTVVFPAPTDATNEMLSAVRGSIAALFAPGERYRKSGVVFFGLEHADGARQLDFRDALFGGEDAAGCACARRPETPSALYSAVDALNARFGKGRVFSAAEGIERKWTMKRSMLSPRSTTNWRELPVVR